MKVCFDSCSMAINHTNDTKMFGVFYSNKNEVDFSIHVHECCEIFLCLSGGKSFLIDDRIYEVSDGDLFVINQFETHKITFEPGKVFQGAFLKYTRPSYTRVQRTKRIYPLL